MKTLYSEKDNSYNFIHDNGMQTSIKVTPSGSFIPSHLTRDNPLTVNKNKYTVIVSSSLGCQMACSFCHLTKNNKPFVEVTTQSIIDNTMEAIEYVNNEQSLSDRYIKLCFMGEGEPILDMKRTSDITHTVIDEVLSKGMAKGLDGVDISTSMPKVPKAVMKKVDKLDEYLINSNDAEEVYVILANEIKDFLGDL
jgi:adenine C2-methylase RlmN of 23S rRNA A2503 and tRNA A37